MISWKKAAQYILNTFESNGYEAFIVGGAVRDHILNRQINDIDICTNATIEQIKKLFPRTIEIGVRHGTILVPVDGRPIEVTQYKKERNKETYTLHTDLSLRDFSCNAMAMDQAGNIIDPFHGREAIDNRSIELVGNNPERLKEDPLRILRGLRFAIQLNFRIEENTELWMEKLSYLLSKPAIERIAGELEKIACEKLTKNKLAYLLNHSIFKKLPPLFLNQSIRDYCTSNNYKDDWYICGSMEWWTFAAYSDKTYETKDILKRYKRSNQLTKDVLLIVSYVHNGLEEMLNEYDLYRLGEERIPIVEKLLVILSDSKQVSSYMSRYNDLPIYSKKELSISGKNIVDWFPKVQGAEIGKLLMEVEKAVVFGNVQNTKNEIYQWLKKEQGL
ncbi:CCA tRNA nucleotidyltransferase [Evansella sp. AB-P1]|uniref:CCA tRNA nucleotidyltransferase n=1 Tax=Evansella sp. AB-P1 TaxID=3037653 RepID=UPI00241F6DC9|nr:CCA tRNA nucleotidyltransferase [Evansella sp. AB-P1]MDG5787568.1 CCA tRNA nucleotidyltransferase [Evansella sp. AB-P1]